MKPRPTVSVFRDPMRFVAMAHRGGEGQWPSNTLYAFERAVSLGADAIELDIHLSADGVLIVRHDPVVETTTDGRGAIRDLTLDEIKALDAGFTWTADEGQSFPFRGQGITIPTLDEVIQAFPDTWINIDIKPQEAHAAIQLSRALNQYKASDRVVVGSFHERQLRLFRRLCPSVATAAGVVETRAFFSLSLLRLSHFYHPKVFALQIPEASNGLQLVTPRFIRDAHAQNIRVNVWTVNETEDMRRLIDWGVDGLISDYPERLLKVLGRL
jgi:glycerophosphoryl diester phosphodiesterase